MLALAWPWAAALALLPALVAWRLPRAAPLATPLRVPFLERARGWQRAAGGARPRLPLILAALAWLALVGAACRPQWVGEPVGLPASGRSMLLVVDVSASMRDAAMGTELGVDVMRRTARRFVEGRAGDRIGLIVFGSRPYVQAPLTFDLHAVAEMVEQSFVGIAGEGTALGDAVGLGVSRLRTMPLDERVMVLLTDGSSTDGVLAVEDAARLARHYRVRVHAIGIGKPRTGQELRAGEGLDEAALENVAAQTGGRYYRADDAAGLAKIYRAIEAQEPVAVDERVYRPTDEWYVWPLLAALALALGAFAAGWREGRG
jgi:Ca-activated chloride channel family protein